MKVTLPSMTPRGRHLLRRWAGEEAQRAAALATLQLRATWHLYFALDDAEEGRRLASAPGPETLFAMDKDAEGRKVYALATPLAAYWALFGLRTDTINDVADGRHVGRFLYEVLDDDRPLRPYFDLDLSAVENPHVTEEAVARAALDAFCFFANEAYQEVPSRPRRRFEVDVETAHAPGVKYSYHVKGRAECGILKDKAAARAFYDRIVALVTAALRAGGEAAERAGQLWVRGKGGVWTWLMDRAVYGHRGLFRCCGASKFYREAGGKPRYLLPAGVTERHEDALPFAAWDAMRVMNVGAEGAHRTLLLPEAWYATEAKVPRARPILEQRAPTATMSTRSWEVVRDPAVIVRVLVAAGEVDPAWLAHLDARRVVVRRGRGLLRLIPQTRYCPVLGGEHSTCACILDVGLEEDGPRTVRCLSSHHPVAAQARWETVKGGWRRRRE